MTLDDYKVVLYRNRPEGWVAEVPAIAGCYALMPTKEDALTELERVFEMIAAEYISGAIARKRGRGRICGRGRYTSWLIVPGCAPFVGHPIPPTPKKRRARCAEI